MGGFGEAARLDVLGIFGEGGDAFFLEAGVFLAEVPVHPGVAGNALFIIAEDVVGKEELSIASIAGTEGHEQERGFAAEVGGELMGHEFEFGGIGAGAFETLHLLVKLAGFGRSSADGADVCPGGVAGNHAEVPNDGDAFAGHRLNDPGAGRAVNRAGPEFQGAETDADGLLRTRQPVRRGARDEAAGRGLDQKGETGLGGRGIEAAAQEIDLRLFRSGGFLRRFDVDVSEATLSLELPQVVNGVFLGRSQHDGRV